MRIGDMAREGFRGFKLLPQVITNSGIKLMVFKKPDALDGNLSSSEAAGGLKKGLASESLHFA
ncbi:hypothetical protein PSYJA_14302 [Pseudomonas syringae pv. japonica str. M301072]|uniref:Uncharacterized protein n=1 Tax=Pseudomonas syringae pv. japonica str. M301072 TaxID=629262 RepID=F3FIN7_PSESX|nr:hypothetical protein PSYJA_14302 [Pseudomonas syringae pv. japonica str. M301072]